MYRPKYPKASDYLEKDREELLACYDFPAEHWLHLRTTNTIESTFATVRLSTAKTQGCVSRDSILVKSAERHWHFLNDGKPCRRPNSGFVEWGTSEAGCLPFYEGR